MSSSSSFSLLHILLRLASVFFVAAANAIAVGALIDVAALKSAVMAGSFAVIEVVRSLALAYRDGKLTKEELDSSLGG